MRSIRDLGITDRPWARFLSRPRPRALYGNLIAAMRERLEREPGDVVLRYSLAAHLDRAGRYDEALEEVEKLVHAEPVVAGARRLRASLRLKRLLRVQSLSR